MTAYFKPLWARDVWWQEIYRGWKSSRDPLLSPLPPRTSQKIENFPILSSHRQIAIEPSSPVSNLLNVNINTAPLFKRKFIRKDRLSQTYARRMGNGGKNE